MASGGPRNRSGPPVDPRSGRSDQRGLTFITLPREGFTGRVPAFPLPKASARERAVWGELWRTPQAAQWISEPWRMRTIALYARWSVRMEEPDAPSSLGVVVHRLGDSIGMTPAGLRENGWLIAADEVAARKAAKPERVPAVQRERRMRAVPGGAG